MSSLAFTNRRQFWSNQHPLRKQRSLIEGSGYFSNNHSRSLSGHTPHTNSSTHIFLERCAERSRNTFLKKQFSVDGIQKNRNSNSNSLMHRNHLNYNTRNEATNVNNKSNKLTASNSNNNNNNNNSNNNNKTITNCQNNVENGDVVAGISVPWSKTTDSNSSSEISGYSASRKKQTNRGGQVEQKKSFRIGVGDRGRKHSKGEDKININIFLSETLKTNENDGVSSDLETSSSETDDNLDEENSEIKADTPSKVNTKIVLPKKCADQLPIANINTQRKPQSAATRRAQFQANRENSKLNRLNSGPISASPSLTIQRRPPLVRAMSAPVNTQKNMLTNKRKSRRKATIGRNSSCDKTSPLGDKIIEQSNFHDNDSALGNNDTKNQNKINNKMRGGRSNLGCDVVTLVSLISSEGSDSEKEDANSNTITKDNSPVRRPPFLRKTGKSVSFQENDQLNFHSVVKEFPHMLRRGSIAPLAARIRANRPPTAPPVSIFLSDYDQSTKMSDRRKGCSKDDISIRKSSTQVSAESKENNPLNNNNKLDNMNCPDYVQSFKERECWKLFQKMSNKGVFVSYETITKGMLTPTEFRNLQKQKDEETARLEEAAKLQEADLNTNN